MPTTRNANREKRELISDPRRTRTVPMGATDRLRQSPVNESERMLNRRVEFHLVRAMVGDPDPPKPPDPKPNPATELGKRTTRCIELLEKRALPGGPVQAGRMRCIMTKLRDNAAADDRFVDGDLTTVIIKAQRINGLQEILRSYGRVTDTEFNQFFERARSVILASPGFASTASDEELIRAIAADKTKLRLNDFIANGQNPPGSIYSCR